MNNSGNKPINSIPLNNNDSDNTNLNASNAILTWYLSKINEMNLQYYEGENKNIIVEYPPNLDKYICISNQVRNSNEQDLLNDIACIFSCVECLNILKKSDINFSYGVRLIINPTSSINKQRILSDNLFCYIEVKIVDKDINNSSIGIVTKLVSKGGSTQYLSKSLQKIFETTIKGLGYKFHFVEDYTVEEFDYLPVNIPIGFILFPKYKQEFGKDNEKMPFINIEKTSQLLLNTIKKLNE